MEDLILNAYILFEERPSPSPSVPPPVNDCVGRGVIHALGGDEIGEKADEGTT